MKIIINHLTKKGMRFSRGGFFYSRTSDFYQQAAKVEICGETILLLIGLRSFYSYLNQTVQSFPGAVMMSSFSWDV